MRRIKRELPYMLVAILILLLVIPASAQIASDEVQVRLSLAGRKSVYRAGAAGDDTRMVIQRMAQVNMIQALMTGKSWKLSEEKINQLKQSCVTKACRQHFHIQ